jgi:hypothetical protein
MSEQFENLIKEDAKSIVDLLFETGALDTKLTRDNMNALEEYIRVIIQSRVNSYCNLVDLKKKHVKLFDKEL